MAAVYDHVGPFDHGLTEGIMEGFLASWSMVLISEIGDKTFFIACLMAMRHPKMVVFTAALSALAVMTVLSAALGWLVPNLLSVRVTQVMAIICFVYFGLKSLKEAFSHSEDDGEEDEMAEAAAAIGKRDDEEEGEAASPQEQPSCVSKFLGRFCSAVFVQGFVLTFLAEWGDRSQISTIVLGAAKNPIGVIVGGIVGHSICTGAAVIFGAIVAQRITPKMVNIIGGFLFLLFACHTTYEMYHSQAHDLH